MDLVTTKGTRCPSSSSVVHHHDEGGQQRQQQQQNMVTIHLDNNNNNNNKYVAEDEGVYYDDEPQQHPTTPSTPSTVKSSSSPGKSSPTTNTSSFREIGHGRKKKKKKKTILLTILVLLIILTILGLGIGLGFGLTKSSDDSNLTTDTETTTDPPTMTPMITTKNHLQNYLLQYSFLNLTVFDDPTSSQSLALQYIESLLLSLDKEIQIDDELMLLPEFITTHYALSVFYYSTGGGESSTWIQSYQFLQSPYDYCTWNNHQQNNPNNENGNIAVVSSSSFQGIKCNENKQVISIQLVNNGLKGNLPQELIALKSLETLILSSNQLEGSLPYWTSSSLPPSSPPKSSDGGYSDGTSDDDSPIIPPIPPPPPIRRIDLQGNNIQGTIPVDFLLYSYEWINLSFNQLTGTLPVTVSFLTNLQTLNLAENSFIKGKFPSILYLEKLNHLVLSGNQLSGSLPELWPNKVHMVDICNNQLTGTIPVGAISGGMQFLNINKNQITGQLPFSMLLSSSSPKISNLIWFQASHNQLSGSLPWDIMSIKIPTLQVLDVTSNQIDGNLNVLSSGVLMFMNTLRLGSNMLTSTIPTEIGRLTLLRELDLASNQLSGSIPSQLGNLQQLQQLSLGNNTHLQGTIPVELGLLDQLQMATFNSNGFVGTVDFLCPKIPTLQVDCNLVTCSCCETCI